MSDQFSKDQEFMLPANNTFIALSMFAGVELILALLSLWLFRSEVPTPANTGRG